MITVRRIVFSCFMLTVAFSALPKPAFVMAQAAQQQLAEGTHTWGKDGWCYVVQGGRYVRTIYFRLFPDPNNANLFDLYENLRFVRRVQITTTRPVAAPAPGRASAPAPAASRQLSADEIKLQQLINQLNQQVAAQAASRPLPAGTAGTIGGGVEGGLTTTHYYVPAPMSKLDQYLATISQGDINSARIRTWPTCKPEDRQRREWWCQ